MARIEGVEESKASLLTRFVYSQARKRLGKVPEPLTVVANHPTLFKGNGAFEIALERSRLVDRKLKALAEIKASTLVGCPF